MKREIEERLQVKITPEEHNELLYKLIKKFGEDKFDKYRESATFSTVINVLTRGGSAIDIINQLIEIIEKQQSEMSKHYETCPGWMNQFLKNNQRQ